MRKWINKWHRKIALFTSVVLLLLAVTGSVLVYKLEIIKALVAPDVNLTTRLKNADLAVSLDKIRITWGSNRIQLVKAPNIHEPYWSIYLKHEGRRLLRIDNLTELTKNLWVLQVLEFIREMHVTFLIGWTGHIAAFIVGLFLFFLLSSGIYLWIPAWRRFSFTSVFSKQSTRGRALLSHKNLGILLATGLLVLTVTGTVMNGWRISGWIFPEDISVNHQSTVTGPAEALKTKALLDIAMKAVPNSHPTYIWLPNDDEKHAKFRMRFNDELHMNGKTVVVIDPLSGEIILLDRSDKASFFKRFLHMMWPLHAGYGLPFGYGMFLFFLGLGLIRLIYIGLYGWWRST